MFGLFRCFLLFYVCSCLKPNFGSGHASTIEDFMEDTKLLKENLTEKLDTLASYLGNSLQLMKSMESKFHRAYRSMLGKKTNRTHMQMTGGAIYTRWGNDTCPEESELIYRGFAVGSHSSHTGGGTNIFCTHGKPQFERTYSSNTSLHDYLYGVEYEQIWRSDLVNNDAPCAVCRSLSRSGVVMVPGIHECMNGWHTEYWGFLVGPKHDDMAGSEYVCLDNNPASIEGSYQNHDGRYLYNVWYQCGSLPCPPYRGNYHVPCALCTN